MQVTVKVGFIRYENETKTPGSELSRLSNLF